MRIFDGWTFRSRGAALKGALIVMLYLLVRVAGAQGTTLEAGQRMSRPLSQTPVSVLNGTAAKMDPIDPTQKLRVAFALAAPHPAEQAQFLEEVQDKSSPLFHQFLSAEEWNERFGPTKEDEQAVVDWASAQGLTLTHRYASRLMVGVEAPVATLEKALGVTINHYRLVREDGSLGEETLYSNDRDPVLPEALTRVVQSVQGLNSFNQIRPMVQTGGHVQPPDYVSGEPVGAGETAGVDATPNARELARGDQSGERLTGTAGAPISGLLQPADIWSAAAYNYDALMRQGHCCNPTNTAGHSPRESSIGVAAYGTVTFTDLNAFQAGFPYLAYEVTTIPVDGTYTCMDTPKQLDDNCVETTLDTEWSLSTANSEGSTASTGKVYVYEGSSYSNATILAVYNQMLDDAHARVLTTSYALAEEDSGETGVTQMVAVDNVFQSMVGQGWTLLGSSGDQGSTGNCSDQLVVEFPASDPNMIAVGGTTLRYNFDSSNRAEDSFVSEIAWQGTTGTNPSACGQNSGGSTGGFSEYWKTPSYQSGMGFASRAVPDISLNANTGQNVYYAGAWRGYGGTSISTPMMAGFFAQENAYLLSLGSICGAKSSSPCAPLGNANYPIYAEGKHPNAAHVPFYDIVSGCGSNDITAQFHLTPYCAKAGFDEITGWGTANMLQLAWAINWETADAYGAPYITFTGPTTHKWYHTNQNVSWTIDDYAGGGNFKPTGIAGFTQGWDSIAADASTEPNQGGGPSNSFYTGPEYNNAKTGCLALATGESCSGGVSQGCHTAHVRGWNNQGWTTGDVTYGPVCYDTVAPLVTLSQAGGHGTNGWYTKQPTIFLSATDTGGNAGSGVASGYYAINVPACSTTNLAACLKYNTGFVSDITTQGISNVTAFAEDVAGNFSTVATASIKYDSAPPVTSSGFTGVIQNGSYKGPVTVNLTAKDATSGVAATYYQLDTNRSTPYTGPVKVTGVGTHSLKFYSVDNAGNTEATTTITFTIGS